MIFFIVDYIFIFSWVKVKVSSLTGSLDGLDMIRWSRHFVLHTDKNDGLKKGELQLVTTAFNL